METPKKLTLTFYSDPGHGWLELPRALFEALNVTLSRYSYYSHSRQMVYAEEDCDAPKVLDALKTQGYETEISDKHLVSVNENFIRKCFSIEDMPNVIGAYRA